MTKSLEAFHRDERGMEAMQVVMILAFAALVLVAAKTFFGGIKAWAQKSIEGITGWTDGNNPV